MSTTKTTTTTKLTIDYAMVPENVPSLCIPSVRPQMYEEKLQRIIEDLNIGEVTKIDMVPYTPLLSSSRVYRVFIHLKWKIDESTNKIRTKLLNGRQVKVIYEEPWLKEPLFWHIFAASSVEKPPPCPAPAPCLQMAAVAPCLQVAAVAPCLQMAAAPCLQVAAAPCLQVAAVAPCLQMAAVAPCLQMAAAPCLQVAAVAPCLQVSAVAREEERERECEPEPTTTTTPPLLHEFEYDYDKDDDDVSETLSEEYLSASLELSSLSSSSCSSSSSNTEPRRQRLTLDVDDYGVAEMAMVYTNLPAVSELPKKRKKSTIASVKKIINVVVVTEEKDED